MNVYKKRRKRELQGKKQLKRKLLRKLAFVKRNAGNFFIENWLTNLGNRMRFWRNRDSERRKLRRTLPVADSNSNKLPLPLRHPDCDHRQMHGVHQPVEILMMLHLVLSIVRELVAVGPIPLELIDQNPTIDFLLDLMRLRAQNRPAEPILLQRLL